MKTFKLKALPVAIAAAAAMIPYSLSAQPIVTLSTGFNASAMSSISSPALGPLAGTHEVGLGHTFDAAVHNPSGSESESSDSGNDDAMAMTLPGLSDGSSSDQEAPADAVANAIASLEGNAGDDDSANNDVVAAADEATTGVTSTLEEASQQEQEPASEQDDDSSDQEAPADAVASAIASLEGNAGGDDSANNDVVAAADEATTEVTSTLEEASQQEQEPAPEQETASTDEAEATDEQAEDGGTQPGVPSSAGMDAVANAQADGEIGFNL